MSGNTILFSSEIGDINFPITPNSIDKMTIGAGTPAPGTFAGIGSTVPFQAYDAVATAPTTNNLNLTGANISGGLVLNVTNLTAALSAGATATLPTVAALVAAMQAAGQIPTVGGSYELDLMNSSSGNFAWTVTTNTGWTLNGTMTVAQNTLRKCIVTFTSLTTATLQSLGQFAINSGI